jgi:hypothetical protein
VWKIVPVVQAAFTTEKNISFPSGENVGYVSNLLLSETTPGAKICGMLPGGVCPRYELSVVNDCAGHVFNNNIYVAKNIDILMIFCLWFKYIGFVKRIT